MDKITILLQDKQTIEKLAADPEVNIRIKDSILDGIGKRAVKFNNITSALISAAKKEIRQEFFGNTWQDILKDEYKQVIRNKAKAEFNHIFNKEFVKCSEEINKSIRAWKSEVLKKLKEYDIEKDIREVTEMVIRDKFKS